MRNTLVVLIAALGVAACSQGLPTAPGSPASTDGTAAVVGVDTSVTGSAHSLSGEEMRAVTFSAIKRADGTVTGEAQINVRVLDAWWHTRIECVTVVGNRALLGGTITAASDSRIRVGTKSYFWVEDNGEGNGAVPDRVSLAGANETQQGLDDFCGLVQNLLPGRDVLRGNVQIH